MSRTLAAGVVVSCLAATSPCASAQTAQEEPASRASDAPTYPELLRFQAEQFQKTIETQREVSEAAIAASVRGQALLETVIAVGGLTFTVLTLVGGWYFRRELKKFEDVSAKCDRLFESVDSRARELRGQGSLFEADLRKLASEINPLQRQVEACVASVDVVKASIDAIEQAGPINERFSEVMLKARLAELRITLIAGTDQEKVRAVQAVSEIARGERGAVAVPVLLDALRRSETPAPVAAEALYGLGARAREINSDQQAEDLIVTASKSQHDSVRLQAVETMGKHEPMSVAFQTRLRECANADLNGEVKAAAHRIVAALS